VVADVEKRGDCGVGLGTGFAPPMIKDLDAFMGEMAKGIPLGREGTVDDIASAALFLASEESSYITGDSIRVGGGMPNRAAP